MRLRWVFGGINADVELRGDVLVAFAFRDHLKNFALARGEFVAVGFTLLLESTDIVLGEYLADGRAEEGFALNHGFDGTDNVGNGGTFEQVGASAGLQSAHDIGLVGIHAEDDDSGGRILGDDLARGFDAVEIRHADIHDDDIRRERGCELHGLRAVFHADNVGIRMKLE